MSLIEWIAAGFGFVCVLLYIRQHIWSWPTGLVQVILYAWVFYHQQLYADFVLQLIYIPLQIYGWNQWVTRGPMQPELPITRLSRAASGAWLLVAMVVTAALGFILHRKTDAALPYWDATIAVLSLIAQYLIARKVLENWLIWIVVDVVAIGVFFAKGLYPTTALYALFLIMATAGWWTWRHSYQQTCLPILSSGEDSSSASSFPPTAGISSSSISPGSTSSS